MLEKGLPRLLHAKSTTGLPKAIVSHLISSRHRLPRFPLRTLCSLVTLAVRVSTIMENPGKKNSWKVMENLFIIESLEILLRAEKIFF